MLFSQMPHFIFRSSHQRCSAKKGVLRNFTKFTGKHLCQSLFFKAYFKRMPPKTLEYCNYSKFSGEVFLHKMDQELNKGIIYNSQDKQCALFSDIFRTILNHHNPLKSKRIRGKQTEFLTKELSKSIMNRSRYKNTYMKWPYRETCLIKKLKKKKAKNTYFEKATENGKVTKKFGVQSNLSFHQKDSFMTITYQLKLIIKSMKMSLNELNSLN